MCVGAEQQEGGVFCTKGDARVTPIGKILRATSIDELPQFVNILKGEMSFVGPRPDVPGYADKLQGEDRDVLKLRPGITGPASLKYRDEEEMIADFVSKVKLGDNDIKEKYSEVDFTSKTDTEIAVWYNDNVIYPDKVRINLYYQRNYSFVKDIKMIICTILGKRMLYNGEYI
jgi:lipopolysaccharide/colanic/teichoic acid biosynthesis glycosyltransferase